MYLFPKKEEKEAIPVKAEKTISLRRVLTAVGIVLAMILLLASLIFIKTQREKRLQGQDLPLPDLRASKSERLKGVNEADAKKLSELFTDEDGSLFPRLSAKKKTEDDPLSPWVLRPETYREASADERLLQGEVLLSLRDRGAFNQWLAREEAFDGEAAMPKWRVELGRCRLLLIAQKLFPGRAYEKAIQDAEKELLPVFQEEPEGLAFSVLEQSYPEVDAARKNEPAKGERVEGIPLYWVDLWTLQQFSERDPDSWQEIFEKWEKRCAQALLDSGFYAYAYEPEEGYYLPSAGETFMVDALASLRQARLLAEIGKTPDISTFTEILIRDGGLRAFYNMASLESVAESRLSPAVLGEALRLYRLLGDDLMADTCKDALEGIRTHEGPEALQELFLWKDEESDVLFADFPDQMLPLLGENCRQN